MSHTQVLIVGAGPTGLTLACELARRGIDIRIIERSPEYQQGSRAKGLQPRSLEVFDDLGIAQKAMRFGNNSVVFRRFSGNQVLGEAKANIFQREDTQYQRGLMIPQWKIEELLREKLGEYGVSVEFGASLEDFLQTDGIVTAVLQTTHGLEELTCDYLIGCDGGKSKVRKALNIGFTGETREDERALIGDVEVEGLTPDAWHIWLHPTYGFGIALCPFVCTNSWQLQAIALPDEQGNIPEPNIETFNRVFQQLANMPQVVLKNASWQSVYRVNIRMAENYSVGRVFIAGDAAHVHSIAGGLGMNTGIQDAYNLGWKLAAVLHKQAGAALLDTYEEERLPIAAWTLNISTERQKAMVAASIAGTGGMENSATKDTTQLNLNYRYSKLSVNKATHEHSLQAGDRAPDCKLSDGSWLFNIYRGTHFTLLGFGAAEELIQGINAAFAGQVKAYTITEQAVIAAYGNCDGLFVIRPDGYIGLIADAGDETAVMQYLQQFLHNRLAPVEG